MLSAGALLIFFIVGIRLKKSENRKIQMAGIATQIVVAIIFLIQTAIKLELLPL